MARTYCYWENADQSEGCFEELRDNDKIIRHDLDGCPMALVFRVQAETFEEAAAIRNLRLGFSPYFPMGKPQKCPVCSHGHFYLGSGECFCGYKQE